jgi:hypothetical protein
MTICLHTLVARVICVAYKFQELKRSLDFLLLFHQGKSKSKDLRGDFFGG